VALARQNDEHHAWAAGLSQRITEPLLTCESVLAEAAFHLESSSYVLALLDDELLKLSFSLSNNIAQVKDLAARYADRKPDLADLCLIRMCELYPRHSLTRPQPFPPYKISIARVAFSFFGVDLIQQASLR